jgi:hypothetical protein
MKKTDLPSKIRCLSLMGLALVIMVGCYVYHNYYTYNSIKVVVKKNAAIEYGSANYNLSDLIKKVDGEIISVRNDIDTKVVGEQEVVVEVKKDNIVKDVPLVVNVVDTAAPVVNLKEDVVYITEGEEFDVNSNIESIVDEVDGSISYSDSVDENSTYYYDFTYDHESINNVGEHEVIVNAKDKSGNVIFKSYKLVVEEKPAYVPTYSNYGSAPASAYGSDVVSIAYSLLGSPYIGGSNGPYGFDCSGFVQYVYSQVGVSVTRSTWSQIGDGVGVSLADAQPGDILVWGYSGYPTHSALYVGNGMMIHAANPSEGVILSSIDWWSRGGTTILAVRRVN